jgi:hypothetical protein
MNIPYQQNVVVERGFAPWQLPAFIILALLKINNTVF